MEQRPLGRTGLRVSRLGLGTMGWGGSVSPEEAASQLDVFLDAGGTLIDCAAAYADGEAERVLGSLLAGGLREDVVLATKAGISRRSGERVVDTSRRALLHDLDGSLARLGVEYVDLWQVHAWGSAPLEETLETLDFALDSGRARYVGISNYSGWQTGTAAAWQSAWPGRARLACTQVEWSLLRRGVESGVLPAAAHHAMGVLAWSPLAGGVLTGKYAGGVPRDARGAEQAWRTRVAGYLDERSASVVDAVMTAAEGLGASPLAVSLAWLRDRPGLSAALVGARTAAQLVGVLESESLELPQEIRAALDDVSA
jgi:aryl-alcohol dehydrogenase-like predicted oxidoreductase